MKQFELTKKMISMGGTFYPTGYAFIMFPDPEDAKQVAQELEVGSDGVMLLTPEEILADIGRADGHSDVNLPRVGTEGATVHKYVDLAREGFQSGTIALRPLRDRHYSRSSMARLWYFCA